MTNFPLFRMLRSPVAVLAAVLCSASLAPAQSFDRWYVVTLGDQRAGWMHTAVEESDGTITTRSTMEFSIRRGEISVEIGMSSEFVETADGHAVSARGEQRLGALPIVTTMTFSDKGVKVESKGVGLGQKQEAALDDVEWYPPAAAMRRFQKLRDAGETTITMTSIDPLVGATPITATRTGLTPDTVEVMGKTVPALRCTTTMSLYPDIESVEYVDDTGMPLWTRTDLGGIVMTMIAADKDVALAKIDAPELMASTFVQLDGPIPGARKARRATYRLSVDNGKLPELPSAGAQRFERLDESSGLISIDLDRTPAADAHDRDDPSLLKSSSMITSDDAVVRRLVARATKDADEDPAARAEAMRRFVYDHIDEKGLGVGFATAGEVARTGEGDCSEHGVLLAALLRADGIPSRVASGLLYVDSFLGAKNVFGYHMWAQALLEIDGEPRWVDLDGTFPPQLTTDATHIALVVTGMSDDDSTFGLVPMVSLLGRLSIDVESVE